MFASSRSAAWALVEQMYDATGNLSAQGVDAMLDAVGLQFVRRSVPIQASGVHDMDVDEHVLQCYERSGFIGLIAFMGAGAHYVALRYAVEQDCYVYLDSISRSVAAGDDGELTNCSLYSRSRIIAWLRTHCYHVQNGMLRAAFVWAVSSRPLPAVSALRHAAPSHTLARAHSASASWHPLSILNVSAQLHGAAHGSGPGPYTAGSGATGSQPGATGSSAPTTGVSRTEHEAGDRKRTCMQ
jgi:hypothetical protein